MQEFYIKDKNTNVAFRGFVATTDINCPPFDFFRLAHANHWASLFQDVLNVKCPIPIPDDLVRQFILKETDEKIAQMLSDSNPHPVIHKLLTDDTLSHKEQEKLLLQII